MSDANLVPAMTVAFAVTSAFMLALRPLARSVGLVDRPGGRKLHTGNVPIIGGIAMFIGMFAGFTLLDVPGQLLVALLVASALLASIGVLDDKYSLPANVRIATQIAVALIMIYGADLLVTRLGNPLGLGEIQLGPLSLVFTMAVTLTIVNAYNLIDGADGLAGSLALIFMLSIAVAGGYAAPGSALALTVAAAIVGFLIFNFPAAWNRPVRSFMGDAGSTLLGFTIVWITLGVSQGADRVISPVLCLWFAAIPIFDCLTCFVRRIMNGRSPFEPDLDHFHHTLQRGGLGVRRTLGLLTGVQLLYAGLALAAHFGAVADSLMFAIWCGLGLIQRPVIKAIARHSRRFMGEQQVRAAEQAVRFGASEHSRARDHGGQAVHRD